MKTFSAAVLLFLVMDPIGNIPLFVAALNGVEPGKRGRIVVREHVIAFAVLAFFLFAGRYLLHLLQIEDPALSIAGGLILFLIALRMIFVRPEAIFGDGMEGEPFIVPLAVPFIAGPSTMTTVLLMSTREPDRWPQWLLALGAAWLASVVILLPAVSLSRLLGVKVLAAFERLMGMLLTAIAVQMFLTGLRQFLAAPAS
jgi:MarC family membrane protein